jgi:hypothetical protein
MTVDDLEASGEALAQLEAEVQRRVLALPGEGPGAYVGSGIGAVNRALVRIRAEGLASGPLFCEWGSGLGGVCGVAALNGFTPVGIEIESELIDAARSMAKDLGLPTVFAEGTFLLPGDEPLVADTSHTHCTFEYDAWDALGVAPGDCDIVFAYPWPGEEACVDGVFARHASSGALLLTFHDRDLVLLQRKLTDSENLQSLGWM